MNIIDQIDAEHIAEIESKRKLPEFSPGDTVRVDVRVSEGARTRIQAYEGVCIARAGGGLHENFTVRKISYGEGVERTFPVYSPMIEGVEVVKRGKVRRAKLYYLRDRRGKSARIAEATNARAKRLNEEQMRRDVRKKSGKKLDEEQVATDSIEENLADSNAQVENQTNVASQVEDGLKSNDQAPVEANEENRTEVDSQEPVQSTAETTSEGSAVEESKDNDQFSADSNSENQDDNQNSGENRSNA